MVKDTGLVLLDVLREQRKHFERLADGTRRITDHLLYNSCEEEAYQLQMKIGRENKKAKEKRENKKKHNLKAKK